MIPRFSHGTSKLRFCQLGVRCESLITLWATTRPRMVPTTIEVSATNEDSIRKLSCTIRFRKRMVQLSFLIESSFVALTSIVVGTILGLVVAHNVISDSQRTPSWQNLSFDVPWLNLGIIFLAVYLVALATTFAPARRASRIYPAQALRYQ